MRILIVGAGTIGANLAAALVAEKQDVIIMDIREENLSSLENSVDCQIVEGNAVSPLALENLGIRHMDLVIALTENDAVNITVCRLADFYGVPRKMARIRNPELADPNSVVPSEHFGIDHIISPERLTVDHIEHLVECPGAHEAVDFEHGRIAVRAMVVSEESTVAGQSVSAVREDVGGEFLLVAIRRGIRVLIPDGNEVLRIGDTVYIISSPDQIMNIATIFDPGVKPTKRVMIFGAGVAGVELARRLSNKIQHVIVVEEDENLAQAAAETLDDNRVEILNGSALDEDLMARAGIENCDYFISMSDDDENNFMSALLYRRFGNGTPVVVTSKPHYIDILDSVDLDIAINPRNLAVSALLRHLRGSTVLSAAKLRREDAEIVELQVNPNAPITKKPLMELHLPRGLLIAAVIREQELHFPLGDFRVQDGDRILVFNESQHHKYLTNLVRAQLKHK